MLSYWKLTMIFEDGRFGWSENQHLVDAEASLEGVLPGVKAFCTARRKLLAGVKAGEGPRMKGFRLSREGVFRDAYVESIPEATSLKDGEAQADQIPNEPWDALLVRGEAQLNYRKLFYLSGVSSNIFLPGAKFNIIDTLQPYWQSYTKALTSGVWGVLAQDRSLATAPDHVITAMAITDAGSDNVVVTCPAHAFVVGDIVHIRSARFNPRTEVVRGNYRVDVVPTPNTFVVTSKVTNSEYLGAGSARKFDKVVRQYTNVFADAITHRKRGVGTSPGRGRSRRPIYGK